MSLSLMIVDDSASMRAFIRRVVTVSGLDVDRYHEAADGVEALELLEREVMDVILTDINMPRMNGEELVRRLSESGVTASIPVIVVSTDATALRKDHLTALGAKGYLTKPFLPESLREEIERVLEMPNAG